MAGNDYRKSKSVLHCVVDAQVYVALKCLAVDQGRSVTEIVNVLLKLEVERHGYVGVGSGDRKVSTEAGGFVGSYGGRGSVSDSERGVVGRGIDWDAILEQGRSAKAPVSSVVVSTYDPLEDIA